MGLFLRVSWLWRMNISIKTNLKSFKSTWVELRHLSFHVWFCPQVGFVILVLILLFTYFFKQNLLQRLTKNHGQDLTIFHRTSEIAETLKITTCDISIFKTGNSSLKTLIEEKPEGSFTADLWQGWDLSLLPFQHVHAMLHLLNHPVRHQTSIPKYLSLWRRGSHQLQSDLDEILTVSNFPRSDLTER